MHNLLIQHKKREVDFKFMNSGANDILNEVILKNGIKLELRRPREEDAGDIIKYLNIVGGESDNLLFGKDEVTLTIEQEIEFINSSINAPNTFMLLGIIDNNIVSLSRISGNDRKRIAHNGELAISVRKDYWNIGVGSYVIKELLRFVREDSTIRNITLGVKADNFTAIKLYEKFGFEKVGVHKNYFNIDGNFDDEIIMDLYL